MTIAEGQGDTLLAGGEARPIMNYQSHLTGECGASPEIDWIISFAFIGPPLIDVPATELGSWP